MQVAILLLVAFAQEIPEDQEEFVDLRIGGYVFGRLLECDESRIRLEPKDGEPVTFGWSEVAEEDRWRLLGEGAVLLDDDKLVDVERVQTRYRVVEGTVEKEDEHTLYIRTRGTLVMVGKAAIQRREQVRLPEFRVLDPVRRLNRRAAELDRLDTEGWVRLSKLAFRMDCPERAEVFLRRAPNLADDHWRGFARLAMRHGHPGQSRKFLKKIRNSEEGEKAALGKFWEIHDDLEQVEGVSPRFRLLRRLGKVKHPVCVEYLLRRVREEEETWGVLGALYSLREIGNPEAVGPLIRLFRGLNEPAQRAANDALVEFTGVDKHSDPGAWRSWWNRNREAFLAGTYEPSPAERAGGGSTRTFYGIPVRGKRIVFVVDVSGSMGKTASYHEMNMIASEIPSASSRLLRRIDIAIWQLKKVLRRLPEEASFNLVFFSNDTSTFRPGLVSASKANVKDAVGFVEEVKPGGGTNMVGAVQYALQPTMMEGGGDKETLPPQSVYVLSDGLPNSGDRPLLQETKRLNPKGEVKIHTVFVGPSSADDFDHGRSLMERLAGENGGRCVILGLRPE